MLTAKTLESEGDAIFVDPVQQYLIGHKSDNGSIAF